MVVMMTLSADTLKRLRARAGLTQQELAIRAGLSISRIMSLEQGRQADPRLTTLEKLAKGLGCTLSELVGETPSKSRRPKGK